MIVNEISLVIQNIISFFQSLFLIIFFKKKEMKVENVKKVHTNMLE